MDDDSGNRSAGVFVQPKEGEVGAIKDVATRKRYGGRIELTGVNRVVRSSKRRKITDVSSVDASILSASSSISDSGSVHGGVAAGDSGSVHGGVAVGDDDSDATSLRAQMSVNVNNNTRLSSVQNVRNRALSGGSAVGTHEAEEHLNFGGSSLSHGNMSANVLERFQHVDLLHQQNLAQQRLVRRAYFNDNNGHDIYRGMRMNIDNMRYEELLALGERIGYVSTAVSEETLPKCIKRSIYEVIPSEVKVIGSKEEADDIKCSICQEEYVAGNEIGKLVECQHGFHASCINQWLQLKNWCPNCKTSVVPSQ